MTTKIDITKINFFYKKYNKRSLVIPDPLQYLYGYEPLTDREIVALIASCLAYGNVKQILKSVGIVLNKLGDSPRRFLEQSSKSDILGSFSDFKHRFTTGQELADFLFAVKKIIEVNGSLEKCFCKELSDSDNTVFNALNQFVKKLYRHIPSKINSLLPLPEKGSACKRLNLFLRWMVRKDNVDPGGWAQVPTSKLIVPLDTHLHKICTLLNFTTRKSADMRTALEITEQFKKIDINDPVKYDFALTRMGIRTDMDYSYIKEII